MKTALALIALALAACSSPIVEPDPTDARAPTETPGRSIPGEEVDILNQRIELAYGTEPVAQWHGSFIRMTVEDQWAYVQTSLDESTVELAESMCRDVAAMMFDSESHQIDVTDVRIFGSGGEDLVDCDVPGQPSHDSILARGWPVSAPLASQSETA